MQNRRGLALRDVGGDHAPERPHAARLRRLRDLVAAERLAGQVLGAAPRRHLKQPGLVGDRQRRPGRAGVELADVGDRGRVLGRLAGVGAGGGGVPAAPGRRRRGPRARPPRRPPLPRRPRERARRRRRGRGRPRRAARSAARSGRRSASASPSASRPAAGEREADETAARRGARSVPFDRLARSQAEPAERTAVAGDPAVGRDRSRRGSDGRRARGSARRGAAAPASWRPAPPEITCPPGVTR